MVLDAFSTELHLYTSQAVPLQTIFIGVGTSCSYSANTLHRFSEKIDVVSGMQLTSGWI